MHINKEMCLNLIVLVFSERSWIEQGLKVGEHVIPLARNFNSTDVETGSSNMVH